MAELTNTPIKPRMKGSEVAACLRVTMQTIRMYEAQGKLHPVRLNARKKLYDPDEVARLVGDAPAIAAPAPANPPKATPSRGRVPGTPSPTTQSQATV